MKFNNFSLLMPFLFLVVFFFSKTHQTVGQDLTNINSPGSIVKHPKVSFDGTKMVFVANYDGQFRPYISKLENGIWQTPQLVFDAEINSSFEFQYPQLNFDNSEIYFSGRTPDKLDFDVYTSQLKNDVWAAPELIPIDIHSNVDELSPAFSTNGKKMLFTRPLPADQKANAFCQQIFSVEKLETGVWTAPEQLSPTYNSGCVCAPYYSRDNKTFYYSSYEDILNGQGAKVSRKQFNVFWAKTNGSVQYNPKPLLSFIGDEDMVSFSLTEDSIAYMGFGDIFNSNPKRLSSSVRTMLLPQDFAPEKSSLLKGQVRDLNDNPVQAEVKIIDPYTSKVYQQFECDANGNYQVFLPTGNQYSVLATKESYSIQSKLVETEQAFEILDFQLFKDIEVAFNVFDDEFFFPINTKVSFYDSAFNKLREEEVVIGQQITVPLGQELNIVFNSENYLEDTLNLPLQREVIFTKFDFDIELIRKLESIDFSFNDENSGNNLELELTVYNVTRNERTKRRVKDGKVTLELRDGEVYDISTSAQGYSYYSTKLDLRKKLPRKIEAKLQSVKDQSIVLNNIVFETNSFNLNTLSYVELNKLVTYLQSNETLKVEISAHTDSSGGDAYNLKLSSLRANSVANYLQDNSILKDRLVANGYGESQPKYPNNSQINMAKNRRVEFKILNSTK